MIWQVMLSLVITVLMLQTLKSTALVSTTALVKKVCEAKCGDIEIQYPFGIRIECSMNVWFLINCNETANSSSKAFLSSIHLELLSIDYSQSRLLAKGPIISDSCSGHETGQPVNFRRTPFTFSGYNRFTVIGCNSSALLTNAQPSIVGCQPTCNEKFLEPEGQQPACLGNRCCQTSVPYYLQVFRPKFDNDVAYEQGEEGCKIAFIVEQQYWFEANVKDPYVVHEWDYVPILVDWKINATALESFQIDKETTEYYPITFYEGFDFPYPNNTFLSCRGGFAGNPYLPEGCKDVNECLDPRVRTQCHGLCTNIRGSYRCDGLIIVLGIVVSFGLLIILISIWWLSKFVKKRRKMKRKRKFFKQNGGLLLRQQVNSSLGNVEKTKIFSIKELEKATDRFNMNRIIGQGGQGTVYKGMLVDGRIVAVKKSKKVDEAQLKEFINEVVILSQINHRNVVKLLGCCLETEVPLLVYEFISNGTLHHYLHDQNEEFQLSWTTRLRIAIEVSGALSYLHSAAYVPIYHRDIKSMNILLDEKYRVKVSDFGFSRCIQIDQTHLTTHVLGTFGYVDPEYFQSSQFTEKSDVYSFGVVLVELLTGQEPVSSTRIEEGIGLAAHFNLSMENDKLFDIIDPRIKEQCDKEQVMIVANLAIRCLNSIGRRRPTMKEVTLQLEGIDLPEEESSIQQNATNEIESNPSEDSFTSTVSSSDTHQALDV